MCPIVRITPLKRKINAGSAIGSRNVDSVHLVTQPGEIGCQH
jgi:hypothetical protein